MKFGGRQIRASHPGQRERERESEREREREDPLTFGLKQLAAAPASRYVQLLLRRLNMGARYHGANRPFCDRGGCGRRAYKEAVDGLEFLCHVCHSSVYNEQMSHWALQEVRGSPSRQSSTPLQDFLENPALAKLCMEFLLGDGWALQCRCSRCERPWLNAGWVCPVEHRRHMYLQMLDGFFAGYANFELQYVDWFAAVRRLHDMHTEEIPWDMRELLEFARLSRDQVRTELHEMYPDEFPFPDTPREMYPDAVPFNDAP